MKTYSKELEFTGLLNRYVCTYYPRGSFVIYVRGLGSYRYESLKDFNHALDSLKYHWDLVKK